MALARDRDPYHALAVHQHRQFQRQKQTYVTTDFALAETATSLFRLLSFGAAQQFMARLLYSCRSGRDQLVFVSPAQFEAAWQMRQKYHDKPDISFIDLTSMVVMQDLGIADVFTGDAHVQQVNLGFRLHP